MTDAELAEYNLNHLRGCCEPHTEASELIGVLQAWFHHTSYGRNFYHSIQANLLARVIRRWGYHFDSLYDFANLYVACRRSFLTNEPLPTNLKDPTRVPGVPPRDDR